MAYLKRSTITNRRENTLNLILANEPDDEIKKALENHRDVLDIVEYFEGQVQERFAIEILEIIKIEKSSVEGVSMDFKKKKAMITTEHYHKWIIEIKSTRETTKHKIENNQMRYRVLMFIDQLLNEAPKSSSSKEIQQRIFLNICPSWLEFKQNEPSYKISKFDKFLQAVLEVYFEFCPKDRAFEKWMRYRTNGSSNNNLYP